MKLKDLQTIVLILLPVLFADMAVANRRHFTYTYESAVLPKGSHELEIWNTVRLNRKDFFRGIDTRTEFEFGLGGNFQTSLYLNISSSASFEDGGLINEQSFGFSNEWKYKLMDATSDPIGLALYGEGSVTTTELELEGKIILDKQIDQLLLAFNAVGEHSIVNGIDASSKAAMQTEEIMELDAGAAYFVTPSFTVGLEAREHIKRPPGFEGGGTYSAFFAGPTLSVAGPNWWSAVSIMPQIGGSSKNEDGAVSADKLELVQHEKLEARLVLAFEF
jgi:hypothetical protein